MNVLEKMYKESNNLSDYAQKYFNHLTSIFEKIDYDEIQKVGDLILSVREAGKKMYFIGNGGSAATASHFANDFAIGTRCPEKPFRAISLTDNNAVITALGNDNGYDFIFQKQLEVVLDSGDIVIAISASGNSPNIIKGIEYAKSRNVKTVGLTGFSGGQLRELADYTIHVPTERAEYGPVEDLHMIFDHLLGTYFNQVVFAERAKKQ